MYVSAREDGNSLTILAQNVPDVIVVMLEITAGDTDGDASSSLLVEIVPLV